MTPLRITLGDFNLGSYGVRGVLEVNERVLVDAHTGIEGQRRASRHQVGTASCFGVKTLDRAVVDRQHVVERRLFEEEVLHRLQLFGIGRCEVMRKAEICARVIKLPFIRRQRRVRRIFPGEAVNRARKPAVMIDRSVAGDLEILR